MRFSSLNRMRMDEPNMMVDRAWSVRQHARPSGQPLRGSPKCVRLGLGRLRSLPQLAARDRRTIPAGQAPPRSAHCSIPFSMLGLARSHPLGAAVARSPMDGERRRRRGDGGHPLGEPERPRAATRSRLSSVAATELCVSDCPFRGRDPIPSPRFILPAQRCSRVGGLRKCDCAAAGARPGLDPGGGLAPRLLPRISLP